MSDINRERPEDEQLTPDEITSVGEPALPDEPVATDQPDEPDQPDGISSEERIHYNTGELGFFKAGEQMGIPQEPDNFDDDFDEAFDQVVGKAPAQAETAEGTDDADAAVSAEGVEQPRYASIKTPRAVHEIMNNEGKVEQSGPTQQMRTLIVRLVEEHDPLFFATALEPQYLAAKIDADKMDSENNILKALAERLFDEVQTDRGLYFPGINSTEEALKMFETQNLDAARLLDLIQLTIRKKVDPKYIETYVDQRMNFYLKNYCRQLAGHLSGLMYAKDNESLARKERLIPMLSSRSELDEFVCEKFINYYFAHSYAVFVEFLSFFHHCKEENAKLQLDSNIQKFIQEKCKVDLDGMYDTLKKIKNQMTESDSDPNAFNDQQEENQEAADEVVNADADADADADVRPQTKKTLAGMGSATQPPRETQVVPNPVMLENNESVTVGGEFQSEDKAESAATADQDAASVEVRTEMEEELEPALPDESISPDTPATSEAITIPIVSKAYETAPEQRSETESIHNQTSARVKITNIGLGIGIAAAAVLSVGGIAYYFSRGEKHFEDPKTNEPKIAFKSMPDASAKKHDSRVRRVPEVVKIAEGSLIGETAKQTDAAVAAPKPDAKIPKMEQDFRLIMPLTAKSLPIIAQLQQGRERLRKIAVNENGEVILNDQNPLYNHFGLHLIYQPIDVPRGHALLLNGDKLVNRRGFWYLQNGKRAYYYTGDKLGISAEK